jgi:hypothetical protein
MNDYEIGLEDRKTGKRWAGENYGWQSQESFDKLYVQGKLNPAQQQIDRLVSPITKPLVQAATDFYQNDPIIGPTLRSIGGGISLAFQSAPQPVQQKITEVAQLPQTAAENIAAATGLPVSLTDPFLITDVATGGASALASKGLRQTVKTAVKGLADDVITPPTGLAPAVAGAALTPPISKPRIQGGSVFMSTTSPEWTSPKAGLGSAESPQFKPAVETFERRRAIYEEVKADLKAAYASGEVNAERLKKALAKIGKHEKGVMSTFPYDEANPEAYLTDLRVSQAYRQERAGQRGVLSKLEEEFGRVDPYDVTKPAQQHHVLAKAETKPFVDTLLKLIDTGVGNKDDLVNFFVWPEKYELYPGNVIKNLLDMGEITHTVAQKDPMALHKILDMAGLEFGGRTKARIIKDYGLDKVTNVDELMQAYDRYLQEIAVPSRDIAYKVQDWWYNKTINTLKGQELIDFKQRYAALQDPRKPR